jgi:hypothetical protein
VQQDDSHFSEPPLEGISTETDFDFSFLYSLDFPDLGFPSVPATCGSTNYLESPPSEPLGGVTIETDLNLNDLGLFVPLSVDGGADYLESLLAEAHDGLPIECDPNLDDLGLLPLSPNNGASSNLESSSTQDRTPLSQPYQTPASFSTPTPPSSDMISSRSSPDFSSLSMYAAAWPLPPADKRHSCPICRQRFDAVGRR